MSWHRGIWVLATIAGLLGTVHLALTVLAYPSWTIDALWFVGTGLAMLIAAATNVVGLNSADRRSQTLTIAINLLMAGFFAVAWLVLPGPQVIVGGVVFLALGLLNVGKPIQPRGS